MPSKKQSMKTKQNSHNKKRNIQPRKKTEIHWLGIPPERMNDFIVILVVQFVLLIVALLPLFSIKKVYFPKNKENKTKYSSLWVKIPFGLLCVVSIVASLFIIWIIARHVHFYKNNEHPSGSGVFSFMMAIPMAMMLYLMLPLYIVYRMNIQ